MTSSVERTDLDFKISVALGKTIGFSETIVIYDLKLAIDDRSDKNFLLTSKLYPLGAIYITCIKSWKKKKKKKNSGVQRDFFETCNKWVKW